MGVRDGLEEREEGQGAVGHTRSFYSYWSWVDCARLRCAVPGKGAETATHRKRLYTWVWLGAGRSTAYGHSDRAYEMVSGSECQGVEDGGGGGKRWSKKSVTGKDSRKENGASFSHTPTPRVLALSFRVIFPFLFPHFSFYLFLPSPHSTLPSPTWFVPAQSSLTLHKPSTTGGTRSDTSFSGCLWSY